MWLLYAQLNLGLMHASGQGAPLDLVRAYGWLHQADRNGAAAGARLLRQTAARMNPAQLAHVERLSATA